MATTLTKIVGPFVAGEGCRMAIYQLLFDDSYPTGGEIIDVSGDFDYLYAASCGAVDALADAGYKFDVILPAPATAVTSTNVKVCAHWGGTTSAVLEEFTNTGNLSTVGQLSIVLFGA